jgi:DNA polymerase III subunit epsilon
MVRQIVLDTETTGLEPSQGHRIIEVGCVELVNRRFTGNHFHRYINPNRIIDEGALRIHGISNAFLADKPQFKDIIDDLLEYIKGAELIIHNAPFDVGFLNNEFRLAKRDEEVNDHASVMDTLLLARQMHPGQRNSLDALCKRYQVDNSHRDFHGALLDAKILALVYLAMTGGQGTLFEASEEAVVTPSLSQITESSLHTSSERIPLRVIKANEDELKSHESRLDAITKSAEDKVVWREES